MAFTTSEFIGGAVAAWLWFLGLSTLAFLPLLSFLLWVPLFYTVPWSFGALLLGSPIAFGLGRALQRTRSVTVHLLLFTVLGATIGVVTTALALSVPWSVLATPSIIAFPANVIVCVAATLAVPLGWWLTARRALRRDRGEVPPQPAGVDERFEDGLSTPADQRPEN